MIRGNYIQVIVAFLEEENGRRGGRGGRKEGGREEHTCTMRAMLPIFLGRKAYPTTTTSSSSSSSSCSSSL